MLLNYILPNLWGYSFQHWCQKSKQKQDNRWSSLLKLYVILIIFWPSDACASLTEPVVKWQVLNLKHHFMCFSDLGFTFLFSPNNFCIKSQWIGSKVLPVRTKVLCSFQIGVKFFQWKCGRLSLILSLTTAQTGSQLPGKNVSHYCHWPALVINRGKQFWILLLGFSSFCLIPLLKQSKVRELRGIF